MKKLIILAAIASTISLAANAQNVTFSPEVGLNISTVSQKTAGSTVDNGSKLGLRIGANVGLPVSENFSIEPGLFYSQKGFENINSSILGSTTTNIGLDYLELPINAKYNLNFGIAGKLFITAGPYLAYGIAGKQKMEYNSSTINKTVESDVEWGTDNSQVNPFDFGLNAGIGYETPFRLYVRAQYGYGFGNISNSGNSDNYLRNANLQFSVGYRIGK